MNHIQKTLHKLTYHVDASLDASLIESFRRGMESVRELGVEVDSLFIKREVEKFKQKIEQPKPLTWDEFLKVKELLRYAGWEVVNGYYRWTDGIVEANSNPIAKIDKYGSHWYFRWLSEDEAEDYLWEEAEILGYESPRELESTVLEAEAMFPHYNSKREGENWQPIETVLAAR